MDNTSIATEKQIHDMRGGRRAQTYMNETHPGFTRNMDQEKLENYITPPEITREPTATQLQGLTRDFAATSTVRPKGKWN